MCGICGIFDDRGVRRDDLLQMTDALGHRGPDDSGIELLQRAGIGHRRLSIIDLDTGQQPMCNEDGTLWITFNGEIYNYRELAARLAPRHEFRTRSDTEVLLHLYEELGQACVRELRGMFAFAIYDARNDRLFAARDHLGQKPFYYTERPGRFAFASEIKALLAADPGLRELDGEALCEYLTLRVITPPRSMFRRIRKLPPGHCLTRAGGELKIERYWTLDFEPKLELDAAAAEEELERRMLAAVECHLVSDVPVGAFLSGGMDSSLIVAMMSRFAEPGIKTFAGDLPYGDRSELPYARLVSERFGTDGRELTIGPEAIGELADVIWHLDEPSDPLCVCLYALSRFVRREIKVVLGGDGGDELFAGYDRYYGFRYAGYLARLPRFLREGVVRRLLDSLPHGSWYRSLGHRLRWMLRMAAHDGSTRYAKSLGYFYFSEEYQERLYAPDFRKSLGFFDPEQNIREHFDAGDGREALDRMLHADSATRLPDHPVMILDRMTMAHGLESRSPFLDHEVAEFCARLSPQLKIQGRRTRVIQSRLAAKYLPEQVLSRDKQGFSSAFTYMMARQFDQLNRAFLTDSHLVRDGYLSAEAIATLLSEHLAMRADHGSRLWLLCNSELWYRMFIEDEGRDRIHEQIGRALTSDDSSRLATAGAV